MVKNRCLSCMHCFKVEIDEKKLAELRRELKKEVPNQYTCRAHPPLVHFIPQANEFTKEIVMNAVNIFPQCPPDGYGCGEHTLKQRAIK